VLYIQTINIASLGNFQEICHLNLETGFFVFSIKILFSNRFSVPTGDP